MNIQSIIGSLQDCPCGREHTCELKAVEMGSGLVHETGALLKSQGFPADILLVADQNTLAAAEGILPSLEKSGFRIQYKIYDDLRTADMRDVQLLEGLMDERVAGVLSVGTGSLNDICRLATYRKGRDFAIFATAASMDGFASGSTPITEHDFKVSYTAHQPSVILADTAILAAAPQELKSAGFGDMVAKYIGLVDWQVAQLTIGEYLCPRIFQLTREALVRIVALADRITDRDEAAAEAVMEALILTGVAMRVAGCTRPGSGAEHVVSHFWECKALETGHLSDFHGKKCGVATILVNRIYHEMAEAERVEIHAGNPDWAAICEAYGPRLAPDMMQMNLPTTVTEETTVDRLRAVWPEICRIIKEQLPTDEKLLDLMKRAGCATTIEEIGVSPDLCEQALRYHAYMRRRITLMRLRDMISC